MADQEKVSITTPEGRLTNSSVFAKDIYKDPKTGKEGEASYKVEMAFPWEDLEDLEEALAKAAAAKWGAGAYDDYFDGKVRSPVLDGDAKAKDRESRGKAGDAYAGLGIIRAHTIFNADGADAPGGIAVFGPNAERLEVVEQQEVYNGCYGKALLDVGYYVESNTNRNALMFYLAGFQKTKDGERIAAQRDFSTVFKPVGRTEGEGTKRRRARG